MLDIDVEKYHICYVKSGVYYAPELQYLLAIKSSFFMW